jgi:catechol 2,3-dioxygenase-like lactoylglutathione lyase family enzyme
MRLHHLALRVADVERSRAFYAGLLGLRELRRSLDETGLRSVWLEAGDAVLMLERRLAGTGIDTGSGHLLAFDVRPEAGAGGGLAAWERRLRDAGLEIDSRSAQTVYFHDPDGHRVGLSVHPLPGSSTSPREPTATE